MRNTFIANLLKICVKKSSHCRIACSGHRRSFDCAHGEAGDKTIDEKIVQDGDGNAGDETAGHEGTPKVYVAVDQEGGYADAHGHISHRGDERHSVDELLHHECETEDRDSEYSGEGNRNNHTEER